MIAVLVALDVALVKIESAITRKSEVGIVEIGKCFASVDG